jgi:hypothetical protein
MPELPKLSESSNPLKASIEKSAGKLLVDAGKVLLAAAVPGAALAANLAAPSILALVEGIRDYRSKKKEGQLLDFLEQMAGMLQDHEEILAKLTKPAPGAERDVVVDVFLYHLEQAYQDDEAAKAKYYAAFAVGTMTPWNPDLSTRAVFYEAMKRLRAHELFVLLLFYLSVECDPSVRFTVDAEMRKQIERNKTGPPERCQIELERFGGTTQALSTLASFGLVQQQQATLGAVHSSNARVSYYLTPLGRKLAGIIKPNLEDLRPVPGPLQDGDLEDLKDIRGIYPNAKT